MRSISLLAGRHLSCHPAASAAVSAWQHAQWTVSTADAARTAEAAVAVGVLRSLRGLRTSVAPLAVENVVVPSMGDSITEGAETYPLKSASILPKRCIAFTVSLVAPKGLTSTTMLLLRFSDPQSHRSAETSAQSYMLFCPTFSA